jgi:hypothetical protein
LAKVAVQRSLPVPIQAGAETFPAKAVQVVVNQSLVQTRNPGRVGGVIPFCEDTNQGDGVVFLFCEDTNQGGDIVFPFREDTNRGSRVIPFREDTNRGGGLVFLFREDTNQGGGHEPGRRYSFSVS